MTPGLSNQPPHLDMKQFKLIMKIAHKPKLSNEIWNGLEKIVLDLHQNKSPAYATGNHILETDQGQKEPTCRQIFSDAGEDG